MSPPTNEVRLRVALAEAKASQRCCLRHSMPAGAASRYALGAGGVGAVRPAPAASLISASRYPAGFDFGATPHAWLRSSLPSSAGAAPAGPRARARARARAHAHAHAHAHTHVCSVLPPCLAFCPACSGLFSCTHDVLGALLTLILTSLRPVRFNTPPNHNREPYDTLLYCPISCYLLTSL